MDLIYFFFYCWLAYKLVHIVGWFLTRAPAQSTRRKLMLASWEAPNTGEIYGMMYVPTEPALAWAAKQPGRVTITHMAIKAVALALKACPTVNSRIVFDKSIPHDTVDIGSTSNFFPPHFHENASGVVANG
jgi:hypothetical protein